MENIKIFHSYHKINADNAETLFWQIIDCSSMHATRVTHGQGVVLRQIGGCSHFRSSDKDGGYTI